VKSEMGFTLLIYFGYAWAAERLCKSCLKITGKKEILFVLFLCAGWSFLPSQPVRFLLPVVFIFLFFQGNWEKKILVLSVVLAVITLVGNFCISALSCMVLIWLHVVEKIPEPFMGEGMLNAVEGIGSAAVIAFLYGLSGWSFAAFNGKVRKWYVTLAVPLLVLTAVMTIVNWGAGKGILVRGAEEMGLYYDQLFSHLYIMILCGLSMSGAAFYVAGMNRIYLEQRRSGQYQAQIAAYRMLEEQYERAERLRHDMKNHLIALTGLVQDREWEKMKAYLAKMEDSGSLKSGGNLTGNRVVDALLYSKRERAQAERIVWTCDVQIPGSCAVDEFDLCVLFGNILDNAIEACEKLEDGRRRFIDIQAKMVKSCFLLEVKNSADTAGGQEEREESRSGETTRKRTGLWFEKRGIGLQNISDMVRRYHGVMSVEAGESAYVISVLLPFERGGTRKEAGRAPVRNDE